MKLFVIEPFTAALLLWGTLHAGYATKVYVVDPTIAAHHRYSLAHPPKAKAIHPPKWGKRSIERFFRDYEFVNGAWRKKLTVRS